MDLVSRLPERDDSPYRLRFDNTEAVAYRHNPRCYFWEHVMGLTPPESDRSALMYGQIIHTALEHLYALPMENRVDAVPIIVEKHIETNEDYMQFLIAREWDGSYRTLGRLRTLLHKYFTDEDIVNRDAFHKVLRLEHYWEKPISAELCYGGKGDMLVLDERENEVWFIDHKTTKKNVQGEWYAEGFKTKSYQVTGYHWLGEYALDLLKEAGDVPTDTTFGGVIINAIQTTQQIECKTASLPYRRTPYQVDEFVRNAFLTGMEIVERRETMERLAKAGQPIENAWPFWPTFTEGWCDWNEINLAPSEEYRDSLLEDLKFDPWWVRRRSEGEGD